MTITNDTVANPDNVQGSPGYVAAYYDVKHATRTYDVACKAYRAGLLSDAALLHARAIYMEADAAFEVAYAKESA